MSAFSVKSTLFSKIFEFEGSLSYLYCIYQKEVKSSEGLFSKQEKTKNCEYGNLRHGSCRIEDESTSEFEKKEKK